MKIIIKIFIFFLFQKNITAQNAASFIDITPNKTTRSTEIALGKNDSELKQITPSNNTSSLIKNNLSVKTDSIIFIFEPKVFDPQTMDSKPE